MNTTRTTPHRRIVAAMVTAALALAACGGDDDSAATDPESTEPTSAQTDATDDTVEPAATDPAATDPASTAATDPAATDPAATDPAATDPASTDPASTDPAAEEWRSQFDALCDEAREAGDAFEEPETIGDFKGAIESIIEVGDTLFEDAAELSPPAELEEGFENLADLWDEQRTRLEDLLERIEVGYEDDQALTDIPDEEGRELVGDALDQSALAEQAQELGVSCFSGEE